MKTAIDSICSEHSEYDSCSDKIIAYSEKFDEYGIVIHDGGSSYLKIHFCPFCGAALPESKREQWFDKLESLGYDDPTDQSIPNEFKTNAWYKNT